MKQIIMEKDDFLEKASVIGGDIHELIAEIARETAEELCGKSHNSSNYPEIPDSSKESPQHSAGG